MSVRILDRTDSSMGRAARTVVDWLVTIAVAVGFVLVFQAEVAKPYRIPSPSMEPTLHCARPTASCAALFGDRVIVNRLAYRFRSPRRGEIVVFETPPTAARCGGSAGTTFVKRVVGLPGEQISEVDGEVYVNGKRLVEPYIEAGRRDRMTATWPRVPPDRYFVLGDNRTRSCDSRTWGTVPRGNLIGPIVITYWPPNRLSWRG